ncbi:hypothetical protein BP6252_10102 [Coleophoma cylindrospora]|uniref:Major facilitator superfamily (MFS) profile domain-containing protein n=1 Tax=Coleophoma cylindrospora TaxID=1849047 RepID=A0A3D8QXF6_9HELO|nr:hypothetical protein BP6252_10102 [Coleophoma cylindrospora]
MSDQIPEPQRDTAGTETSSTTTVTEKQDLEAAPAPKPQAPAQWGADVPDGGRQAWMVVFGAWCTAFCSFGWINSVGTFQNYYEATLLKNYTASEISWIPSLQIFFLFVMGPVVGKIYDSYGPRYLLVAGSFLHVFGLMMASISTTYYQLLLSQGICSAIGVACIFQPAMTCVGGWFNKNRGAAYGALSSGSSIGGVVFPIMVSRLIQQVGYGWAMRISAFVILFLLILANLTVRSLHKPSPQILTKADLLKPFHEIGMLAVIGGNCLITFGLFIPITYVVVEAIALGMSPSLAQYLLAMLNAASLFGRIFSGIISDKIGRYNVFVIVCTCTGALVLALWIPVSNNAGTIMFAILFGFFSGAYVSLGPALVAQISPPREIGFRTGLLFLFASVPGLTNGPIAGAILASENGVYTGMKIFSGIMILTGTSCVLVARIYQTGWKLMAKF